MHHLQVLTLIKVNFGEEDPPHYEVDDKKSASQEQIKMDVILNLLLVINKINWIRKVFGTQFKINYVVLLPHLPADQNMW
jgi:hypothetical protein